MSRAARRSRVVDGRGAHASESEAAAQASRAPRSIGITCAAVRRGPRIRRLLSSIPDPPPLLWIKGRRDALLRRHRSPSSDRARATPYGLDHGATDLRAIWPRRAGDRVGPRARRRFRGACGRALGRRQDRRRPRLRDRSDLSARAPELAAQHRAQPARSSASSRRGAAASASLSAAQSHHQRPVRARSSSSRHRRRAARSSPLQPRSNRAATCMVVPGPATGGRNRGGHLLIRDGAKVVESADDILQDIGFARAVTSESRTRASGQLPEAS